MHKLALRLSLPLIAVTVLPGCLEVALIQALENRRDDEAIDEPTYDDSFDDYDYTDTYVTESSLDIRNANLSGDMGEVRDFWDDDPMHAGYAYDGYASIEIHATADDGSAAMVYFNVEGQGALAHPDLAPGSHLEFSNYESTTPNGLYVYMIGCSGPSEGNWYFDQGAEDIVVDVTATPEGNTVIDFQAGFSGQTVVGSAEIGPLQAQ